MEYPKIETLYDRDEKFKVIPGQLRCPEFGLVNEWLVTEKIDGTNMRVFFNLPEDGYAAVRFGGRTDNAQMPTFLYDKLVELFPPFIFGEAFERPSQGILFGEGYGPKIQKGGVYRQDGPSFRLFDVRVGDWWLNWPDVEDVASKLGLATAPMVTASTIDEATVSVRGGVPSVVASDESGNAAIAEGIVARTDPLLFTRRGHRLMWKLKTKDFGGPPNADSEHP